ncbi:MAG: nuclear transport factor 2 family protein [Silvibacterium sp.]
MNSLPDAMQPLESPVSGMSDENEIRSLRLASNRAMAEGDVAAFAASLCDDYVMVRGNGVFSPREVTLSSFARNFGNADAVRFERLTERVELSAAAPLAAEHGRWVGKLRDGRVAYGGAYLAMWRRTDAGWKIRSELFVLLTCDDSDVCAAYQEIAKREMAK